MGFFSVFNNDAIKDVKLYKGDIPASAGGRLSSLLDIRMKDGNSKKFTGTGGLGLISSRLTLEGPIIKDKTSYIISGRRTYADLFLMFSSNEELKDNKLYFYDLNIKVNHNINENNRIFLSGYYGNDILKSEFMKMEWGNKTLSLRWNHLFSKKLFSNITLLRSQFDYDLGVPEGEANSFRWDSKLTDYAVKVDFNYYLNTSNSIKFGYILTHHEFNPGDAIGLGEESMLNEYKVPKNLALEHGIYISNEQKVGPRITVKYGLRYSIFQNIGKGTIYNFDENHNTIDSTVYPKGEIFNTYSGLEPRVGASYVLNEKSSIKASYSKTRQYVHLATNSNAGMPLDVWFPSSPNVKPQISDQIALGYFRNFKNHTIEASAEVYYKMMNNSIDFKDYAELLLNREIEGELRFGEAEAYGLELFVKMQLEKFSGWVSYTLSKSIRKIPEINSGEEYYSPYHKPHDISIVISYELSKRFLIAANWVYSTGAPATFPTGRFEYGGKVVPVYSDRNSYKMNDYHRLDLSLTYKRNKKPDKKWHGEWNLSIYNAYARKNAWTINFQQDEEDPSKTYAEKTYLFGILPSITYNFYF